MKNTNCQGSSETKVKPPKVLLTLFSFSLKAMRNHRLYVGLNPNPLRDKGHMRNKLCVHVMQGGPLPFINGVITPINGLING